jgi:transcriptional regulator with XRE-family HTH domain
MREKLLNLMKAEQLTASKLAELLGIQPSGISHILGGRNKPSFDLVQKILRRFPQVNPDWLLLDQGEMYRTINSSSEESSFENASQDSAVINSDDQSLSYENNTTHTLPNSSPSVANTQESSATALTQHGRVKRVIVLFEDHTFESFEMQR